MLPNNKMNSLSNSWFGVYDELQLKMKTMSIRIDETTKQTNKTCQCSLLKPRIACQAQTLTGLWGRSSEALLEKKKRMPRCRSVFPSPSCSSCRVLCCCSQALSLVAESSSPKSAPWPRIFRLRHPPRILRPLLISATTTRCPEVSLMVFIHLKRLSR